MEPNDQNINTEPGTQTEPATQVEPTTEPTEPSTLAGGAGETGTQTESATEPQGAPESYDFTSSLPEGGELDEEIATSFGELCRGMNLTNEQANQMASYGYQYAETIRNAMEEERVNEVKAWGDTARKELGADFDKTVALCGTGVEHVSRTIPNIRQVLNETGAGNRIEIIKVFATLGKLLKEDGGVGGNGVGGSNDNPYPNTNFDKYR
jgi:hypothetical protein|nr:MAG TPA: putative protease [Caudoviricetes sp.]